MPPILKACLSEVRNWSRRYPDHVPMLLMFNAKTDRSSAPGGVDALPFDTKTFEALDREIREVIPESMLITPDLVQGKHATLREAVTTNGWPTLRASRGKLIFALDEGPAKVAAYLGDRNSLKGRVFFVNAPEDSPVAAYLTLNDPIREADRIRRAVQAGFLVRTRADADTMEPRKGDFRRRDAALNSGAQYISTDYMWPDARLSATYQVRLPYPAACNPVRAASKCAGSAIE